MFPAWESRFTHPEQRGSGKIRSWLSFGLMVNVIQKKDCISYSAWESSRSYFQVVSQSLREEVSGVGHCWAFPLLTADTVSGWAREREHNLCSKRSGVCSLDCDHVLSQWLLIYFLTLVLSKSKNQESPARAAAGPKDWGHTLLLISALTGSPSFRVEFKCICCVKK